jgi:hypothetical protein
VLSLARMIYFGWRLKDERLSLNIHLLSCWEIETEILAWASVSRFEVEGRDRDVSDMCTQDHSISTASSLILSEAEEKETI